MGLFDQFPYTNFHELNLMWILEALKEIQTTTEQFVAINSLKYANPIQWNIVKQYEKNTIVIDPLTGTAYISVQPVPTGVALTNEDYWTVVFDLGSFVTRAAKNFTTRFEENTTLTATFNTAAGQWIVWGDTLYRANVNITAGDSYVVDGNITRITVEEVKDQILQLISNNYDAVINMIGDLDDLTTTAKNTLVDAINELVNNLDAEATAREDADTTLQDADTTLQANIDAEATAREDADQDLKDYIDNQIISIKSPIYYNVQDYGAKGDGITDDTEAFIDAITDAKLTNGVVFVPDVANFYLITSTLVLGSKSYIMGEKEAEIHFTSTNLFSISNFYGSIENLTIVGDNTNNAIYFDLDTAVTYIWRFRHLHITHCVHAFYDNVAGSNYIADCIFDDINCRLTYGTQFLSHRSRGFITLRNFKVDNTSNLRDISWDSIYIADVIGLEMEEVDVVGPVNRGDYTITSYANVWAIRLIGTTDGKASIWLSRVLVDSAPMNGIVINNINYINGNYVESFSLAGNGLFISACNEVELTNVYTRGAKNLSYAPEGANGFALLGCDKVCISNLISTANTGSGLSVYNTNNCHVTNAQLFDNNTRGYVESGTSNYNTIIGASINNNSVANVLQSGTASALSNVIINQTFHASEVGEFAE